MAPKSGKGSSPDCAHLPRRLSIASLLPATEGRRRCGDRISDRARDVGPDGTEYVHGHFHSLTDSNLTATRHQGPIVCRSFPLHFESKIIKIHITNISIPPVGQTCECPFRTRVARNEFLLMRNTRFPLAHLGSLLPAVKSPCKQQKNS
jgi:hypothetical protein